MRGLGREVSEHRAECHHFLTSKDLPFCPHKCSTEGSENNLNDSLKLYIICEPCGDALNFFLSFPTLSTMLAELTANLIDIVMQRGRSSIMLPS